MNSKAIRAFSVRRIIAILAGVAVALGITVATASSATARPLEVHHRCATRADYGKLRHGQSLAKVQRELHQRGKVTYDESYWGKHYQSREFRGCGYMSYVETTWQGRIGAPLRLRNRSAYWG